MATVQFWFEFASTYSYPAAMRIEALAQEVGVALQYKPFLLGPIFAQKGWSTSPFNLFPEKGRYMWRDLERTCEAEGIPFRKPSVFPRNGLLAARVACWAAEAPWLPSFVRAVYRANFEQDLDIADEKVVSRVLTEVGQDPAQVLAQATSPENKERLRKQTETAQNLGIFGAPSFVVAGELFWGNDRLEQALAWAKRP